MAGRSRYSVSGKEAGMDGDVLRNKLGIKNQKELDDAETILLSDTYEFFFKKLKTDGLLLDLSLLFKLHKYFLSPLYSWAGKMRRINISKGDVLFAPAEYLEQSLKTFETEFAKLAPSSGDTKKVAAHKLAVIHNELNALHPFREGNGRTIRLFLDLVAAAVGYEPIDWGNSSHKIYIQACKAGMVKEHAAMERLIHKGLLRHV
jgi:cell filamentation protein